MLSVIFQKISDQLVQLAVDVRPQMPSLQIGFAENWEEQGGAPRILMRPIKGMGGGPNFFNMNNQSLTTQKMVRKVWTLCEFQCWGSPGATQIQNTDQAETLRQMVIVALAQAIPGDYRYRGDAWNNKAEAMMNGRCVTMTVEIEQPITDLPFYDTLAEIEHLEITGELEPAE